MHVSKWYPYEEAVKVPMIVSCPGRVAEGGKDTTHLVTGLDVMATMCDYAAAAPPEHCGGLSLRPLLEGRPTKWRRFVVSEFMVDGRMVRTPRHKYVVFKGDPVEMLFDMKADPWETRNLYEDPKCSEALAEHRRMLTEFEARLATVEPTAGAQRQRRGGQREKRQQ